MNKELVGIIKERLPEDVIHHDWWCYMVATYLGTMYYDENSYIYYRQHANNEVGASGTTLGMMKAKNRDLQRRQGDLKIQLQDNVKACLLDEQLRNNFKRDSQEEKVRAQLAIYDYLKKKN
jgi:hypothetical protein